MKKLGILIILLLMAGLCFSEEKPEESAIITAFNALPDSPSDAEFAAFYTKLLEEARFNGKATFDLNNFYDREAWQLLGLSDFYKCLQQRWSALNMAEKKIEAETFEYRPSLKEMLLRVYLPRLILESRAVEGSENANLRQLYANILVNELKFDFNARVTNPFTRETRAVATKKFEEDIAVLGIYAKVEAVVASLSEKVVIEGDNAADILKNAYSLADQMTGKPIELLSLLYRLHKLVAGNDVLKPDCPDVLEYDGYTGLRGVLERYVRSEIFDLLKADFSMYEDKWTWWKKSPGSSLLVMFLGSFLSKPLIAGTDAPMGRVSCGYSLLGGNIKHLSFEICPPSLRTPFDDFYSKCMIEHTYLPSPALSGHSLVEVEEGKGGPFWFSGDFLPKDDKGNASVERDFVYPILSAVMPSSRLGFFESMVKSNPFLYHELLDSTDSFAWDKKYYRYDEFAIEKDYAVSTNLSYDFTLDGAKKLLDIGWFDKLFTGHTRIGEPLQRTLERFDRAVYYHFPATKYRIYELARHYHKDLPVLSDPILFIEITPDDSSPPDKTLAAYRWKGEIWVEKTGIMLNHSAGWFSWDNERETWLADISKRCPEIYNKIEDESSRTRKAYLDAYQKRQAGLMGLRYEPKETPNDDGAQFNPNKLLKHRRSVAAKVKELIDDLSDEPSPEEKEEFFSSLKNVLKLRPLLLKGLATTYFNARSPRSFCCGSLFNTSDSSGMLFDETISQHWFDRHTYEGCPRKKFFIENCVVRLALEGDFEQKMLQNSFMADNLKRPDDLAQLRLLEAYILMSVIRQREMDLTNDFWKDEYIKQLAELDELDRKYGVTQCLLNAVAKAEAELGLSALDDAEALNRVRKILSSIDLTIPNAAAAVNWLFDKCPNRLLLNAETPEIIPAISLRKHNDLFRIYVPTSISDPDRNTWTLIPEDRAISFSTAAFDIRVLAAFLNSVLNGDDARRLRDTYFSTAFGSIHGAGFWFSAMRMFSSASAREKLNDIYHRTVMPSYEIFRRIQTTPQVITHEFQSGVLTDVWLPLNCGNAMQQEVGSVGITNVYPIPAVFGYGHLPKSSMFTLDYRFHDPYTLEYSKTLSLKSDLFFTSRDYDGNRLILRSLWKLPCEIAFEMAEGMLKSCTETVLPWSSPIPGLDADEFEAFKKEGYSKGDFSRVIFAHYPRISWRAYSLRKYDSEYMRDTQIFEYQGYAIAIFPSQQELPDKYAPGLIKRRTERLHEPMFIWQDSYSHLEALLQNNSLIGVLSYCGEMHKENQERVKQELNKPRENGIESAWGSMSHKEYSDLFDSISRHCMPYWLGK